MYYEVETKDRGDVWIATVTEFGISSYGQDEEQARIRLGHIMSFYLETANQLGIKSGDMKKFLNNVGHSKDSGPKNN